MKFKFPNQRQLISITLGTAFLLLLAFYYRSQGAFRAAKTSSPPSFLRPPNLKSPSPPPPLNPPPPPPASPTTTATSASDSKPPQDKTTTPHNVTRTLVIASLLEEDTTWASTLTTTDPSLTAAIYIVDSPYPNQTTITDTPYLTVPANKGHEVMVYLTYIIDTYATLPDVAIFMHSHAETWHNNDFLSSSSTLTVQRLRSAKVLRDGYMNLRCHHNPGCPDHIHPTNPADDPGTTSTASEGDSGETNSKDDALNIPESTVMGGAWTELFPTTPIPRVLSQPCCGQFAVSGDRLRSVPLERYVAFREWLLTTTLSDRLSGRVWEYLWQYVFGRVEEYCPDEYTCYCEGYGVCFGGEGAGGREEYLRYFELREKSREIQGEIKRLREDASGKEEEEDGENVKGLERELQALEKSMDEIKAKSGDGG
ncbi:hypothetical protein AJ78_06819 [Emergomyces pasteurianus Ep9510]|uniref:Uncharacterized protein n=1 Tax=Emergomyces pasteurianus Ep9510 TaxID=1447872 RepID=A0A1J9P967_9EURO|nr:hypothetical protein AJ78_06819 [Emergomyces pasteurianus Ep9510]